jgi:hypothetical protein
MMMGSIEDGLQFQPANVIDFVFTPCITFNFSLNVIFFHLVSMLKTVKFNHLQAIHESHIYDTNLIS